MGDFKTGSLVCVGVGMTLGSHISPLARSYIEEAEIVFSLVSDGLVEQWLGEMNPSMTSLQCFYQEGHSRSLAYEQMIECILTSVTQGKRVVAAFYGHPGVFACVPHEAIKRADNLGFYTRMEPGISAEDCLYADLAIDPGEFGCAHYETSQFMFYKRQIDTAAYLILWQVCIAGDTTLSQFSTGREYRQVLVDILLENYPADHNVILYEAPTLAIYHPRKTVLPLSELLEAEINQHSTLVIPPACPLQPNQIVLDKLDALAHKKGHLHLV